MSDEQKKKFKTLRRYECNVCGWTPDQYEPLPRDRICPECGGNIQVMILYKFIDDNDED